jgi:hypothetical protein
LHVVKQFFTIIIPETAETLYPPTRVPTAGIFNTS